MSTVTIPRPTPAGPTPSSWAPAPGGLSALRLVNTIVIAPRVRRALRTAFAV